jgi:fatty acid desaturase
MSEYDEDEIDEYDEFLAQERPFLSRNAICTGMVIFGAVCISIGTGYLIGPGAGWLLLGIVVILAVMLSGGNG